MEINKNRRKLVYLLECGEKYYKIGVATRMSKRLSSIKVGNPFPVNVVTKCLVNQAQQLEREIHHRIKKRKVTGEWFKLEPAEVIEICILINSKIKQKKFYKNLTVLEFGSKKIMDSSRRLWSVQRQELYENKTEAMTLVPSEKLEYIKRTVIKDDSEMVSVAELLIRENGIASASFLQRKMKIGYIRAARIMDELEKKGVIGAGKGAKPRTILSIH